MKHTLAVLGVAALLLTSPQRAIPARGGTFLIQHNLISDLPGSAERRDPNLANPWGIAFSPSGPFWIADNHTGVSTVYSGDGKPFPEDSPLIVKVPSANGSDPGSPTGMVFNATPAFTLATGKPALFLFATEDGTILGWNPTVNADAVIKVDNSASEAIYKGLAIANNGTGNFLYATNFHAGTVDVFDQNFAPGSLPGTFADPNLPAGFAPFGIQNIGGKLYVTFALQDEDKGDDVAGAGNGFVDIFTPDGTLVKRLISNGTLNSPWGLAIAPEGFADFGGSLLVGNFGDGRIHAFDPMTGASRGTLEGPSGRPIEIEGLWAIVFGNGGIAGDPRVLYFTAGISGGGEKEDHGLFGQLRTPN